MAEGEERATLREVYKLVGEVREDLGGRIDKLSETVNTVIKDHEHRLTVSEEHVAALRTEHAALVLRVDDHGRDIGSLKDRQRADEAATAALQGEKIRKVTNRQWFLGSMAVIFSGAIGALISAIAHIHY